MFAKLIKYYYFQKVCKSSNVSRKNLELRELSTRLGMHELPIATAQIRYIQIGNSREIMSPLLMRMRYALASVMHIFY